MVEKYLAELLQKVYKETSIINVVKWLLLYFTGVFSLTRVWI